MALACAASSIHSSVVQQGVELRGEEAHLGGELRRLLAHELRADRRRGIAEDDRFGTHQPVLGATERERIDAGVDRERPQRRRRAAEGGGGIGEPGAVEVHQHPHRCA